MAINIQKQMMSLDKIIARNTQVTWIEQDILVPDTKPDVMKIIEVEAVPFVGTSEVVDSGIRVTGEITYYIVYRAMDKDKTRGISMTYPFSQTINVPEAKKGMNARVTADVRNIIYSLPNERKVSIKTEVIFKYVVREQGDIELIQGMDETEDIETKSSQDVFYNVISTKQEILDAKEDIVIPDSVPKIGEILRVSSNISNTDYKVSYNKILVKGDINVELLYLEAGETDNIFTYTTTIPFTGMIEFENISENYSFDIKYALRNLEISLGEDNMITISAEVIADATMFEEKKIDYVNDFYSTNSNLNYNKSEVAVIKNKEKVNKQITVKDSIGVTDEKNRILSYKIETQHLNTKVSGNNLYVDGPLRITIVFENKDTKIVDSKTYDMLVDATIPLGKEVKEDNVEVTISVANKAVSLQNGNIEANILLDILAEIENIDKITIIGEIEQEEMNANEFDSMYIYIVKKGDNLWDIAKKYKTTVDKIANVNNIIDENKIDIGQKLLIIR